MTQSFASRRSKLLIPLSFALAISLMGCGGEPAKAPQAPPPIVAVAKPIQKDFKNFDEYTGRLEAVSTVELRARVGGYLKQVHFRDGDYVKKGDVLFTIDPSTFEAVVRQREANVERANAAAALAEATVKRNEPLIKQGVISQQEFDVFAAQQKEAKAAVVAATADLESARLDLSFTTIASPLDGRITAADVREGNLIAPNTSLLATVVSIDPVYAYFNIDENQLLDYLRTGRERNEAQDKPLAEMAIPVAMALGNQGAFEFSGVLDYSDPAVDANTGTVRVRGVFANAERRLVPGLFIRVRVEDKVGRPVLQIPVRAVGTDQSNRFVYTIDAQGQVQYRPVKLGRELDGLVIVESGIEPGDTVIVDGALKVRPGSKPNVTQADMSPYTGEKVGS